MFAPALPAETLSVKIAYVVQTAEHTSALDSSRTPVDYGVAGALLGMTDSNTTGRFLQHHYDVHAIQGSEVHDLLVKLQSWLRSNPALLVVSGSDALLRGILALPASRKALTINATNADDHWRNQDCRYGLLHVAPSQAMLADALTQYLVLRRWSEWLLITGSTPDDNALLNAYQRSAKRFGADIDTIRPWQFDTQQRRVSQQEVPALTQGDYDVVLALDAHNEFGFYLPYNTWLPRPVAGTHGLTPTAWHASLEDWGATQLQNRFWQARRRTMTTADYLSWLAVRSIAEGVTRTQSVTPSVLYDYLVSEAFELAAFKGRKLTFRTFNGQLRQPVPLVQPESLVSQSPQPGFLHPSTELDTLGFDPAEVHCSMEKPVP